MLIRAFEWLKPGGKMIYSTCSLLKREGEDQITDFIAHNDQAEIDPIATDALGVPNEWLTKAGCLRTLPSYWPEKGGMDGFFIAKLLKKTG